MNAVYGEDVSDEQLSQAATIAVLRLQNTDTAKWASALIGQYEVLQLSQTTADEGRESQNANLGLRDAVLPSEIMRLPTAGPDNGLHGFFLCPTVGVWRATLPWSDVMEARKPVRKSTTENYIRRVSDPNEELPPWDEAELAELGLSGADLQGETEAEGADEPMPTAEEERALERLSGINFEDEVGS
jgi:hypothetical protein